MFDFFKNILAPPDRSELTEAIRNGALLVDVRSPGEFAAGSVKGAVNIPLEQIGSEISRLKGTPSVVVFCRSGSRSGQAKRILEQRGFRSVINGGTWQNVNECIG